MKKTHCIVLVVFCFFAASFSGETCGLTIDEYENLLKEKLLECWSNGGKENYNTVIKKDTPTVCLDFECGSSSSNSSSSGGGSEDCYPEPGGFGERLGKLVYECLVGKGEPDYSITLKDGESCLDFECKSSSSSSVGSSSSADGAPTSGENCVIDGEYWDVMAKQGVFQRELYPEMPYMLKKNEMYASGCECSEGGLFGCRVQNFGYVRVYDFKASLCDFSHGHWCGGLNNSGGASCDFSGRSLYVYHAESGGWLVDGLLVDYPVSIGDITEYYGIIHNVGTPGEWREMLFTHGAYFPSNVSSFDLEEAALAALPRFPSLDKMHAYCRGEWVPHDDDCYGTEGEVTAALNDSAGACVSLGRVQQYGKDLSERGWCVVGECLPEGCYDSRAAAAAELTKKENECELRGLRPSFVLEGNCVSGDCAERNYGNATPSSSSGEERNECIASKPYLQKPLGYYDDWVYLGKETYGSRHVARSSLKPGTKFFDALGRTYDKMKARIKYYVSKDAIDREEFDFPLEFEVHARIIKDSEGNDIQVFVKEDKARGLRRDSSFYWDGSWEVFEFEKSVNKMSLRNHSGTKSWSIYDDRKRLTESYLIDKNGDTLISEQYKWQNDRLIKTIIDGVERIFVYGKTLQDTVKVIPSDEGLKNYHPGYNGTAGKIPDTNDSGYKRFATNPYRYLSFEYETNESSEIYSAAKKLPVSLAKTSAFFLDSMSAIITKGCVNEDSDMPDTYCVRYKKEKIPDNYDSRRQGTYGYPGKLDTLFYGHSNAQPYFYFECECDVSGKYKLSFDVYTENEYIMIMKSTWKYNNNEKWHERYWERADLQKTYKHETYHIKNIEKALDRILKSAAQTNSHDTNEECRNSAELNLDLMTYKWNEWYKAEQEHGTPESPKYGGHRNDYPCN